MHYIPFMYRYQYPYYANVSMYNYGRQSVYCTFPNEIEHANRFDSFHPSNGDRRISLTDYGPKPFVVNINEATKQN
ncbi:cupin domain-containing protein, partial [Bacillus cereus group sp. Bce001]